MTRRNRFIRWATGLAAAAGLMAVCAGLTCSGFGLGPGGGVNVNTPPTASVIRPTSDLDLENGEQTTIRFRASSFEENGSLDIFLADANDVNRIDLVQGFMVPAGQTIDRTVVFDSTGQANSTYSVFAEVTAITSTGEVQQTRAVAAGRIILTPPGTRPRPRGPSIVVIEPAGNLGIASRDDVTVAYQYTSPERSVTVKLFLDTDRNPNNDCIFQSRLTFQAVTGRRYLIRLGTKPGAVGGAGTLTITCAQGGGQPGFGGQGGQDLCQAAEALSGPGVFTFDNSSASVEPTDPPVCLGSDNNPRIERDVWFDWTATCTGQVTLDTCGATSVDTKIAVYDGAGCPVTANRLIACNDDADAGLVALPSESRQPTDPIFGTDLTLNRPRPDDPNNPPQDVDSIEVRRNPRTLPPTPLVIPAPPAADPRRKTYIFRVDFSRIPQRLDGSPYFLRAQVSDGVNPPVNAYGPGALTTTVLARGAVDLRTVGGIVAGARFQGFSRGENLGTSLLGLGDIDRDTVDDFMIASRYGSPRNRGPTGAAYLFFGRRKTPFPPDTNTNGLPDVRDASGQILDFPEPPSFIFVPRVDDDFNSYRDPVTGEDRISPYDTRLAGRFGGTISVNSLGLPGATGSFYRGTTYLMPAPSPFTTSLPPPALRDADHPGLTTSGLTSITRIDLVNNPIADNNPIDDFIFGVPFVSHSTDFHDDDPCDQNMPNIYPDALPNPISTTPDPRGSDDMTFRQSFPIDGGFFIAVDGANDLFTTFRQFVDAGLTGQFDQMGATDAEGFIHFGTPDDPGDVPNGVRVRGAWLTVPTGLSGLDTTNEFGTHVAAVPSLDNDLRADLMVSAPGTNNGTGAIQLWTGQNFAASGFHADPVLSLPSYVSIRCEIPTRGFRVLPAFVQIDGQAQGDRFGHPRPAGDLNQDGTQDILAGAPAASRPNPRLPTSTVNLSQNGVAYILLTPAGGFGQLDLSVEEVPRIEILGTHTGDRFGAVQDAVSDLNGDGVADVAIASPNYPNQDLDPALDAGRSQRAGFVGVIFGARPITGERGFSPDNFGTARLPGLRFFGATTDARAGTAVASAGDFNGDGIGDLLIASPGESRAVGETFTDLNGNGVFDTGEPFIDTNNNGVRDLVNRRGVAYLIFGGPHLEQNGPEYNLSEVGSPRLPGLVFISPYAEGSVNQAPIENVGGIGDVDADGFDDILIGLPHADFIFPSAVDPNSFDSTSNQRRADAGDVYLIYGSNVP